MMDWLVNAIGTDWLVWPLLVAQFFAIEFKALFNKEDGDTWSEVVRYVFGFSKRSAGQGWWMRGRRVSFYGLMAWFTGHVGLGW